MNTPAPKVLPATPLFASYVELTRALLNPLSGLALLDEHLASLGATGNLDVAQIVGWLRKLNWVESGAVAPEPCADTLRTGRLLTALPISTSDGDLLGVLCIEQPALAARAAPARHAAQLAIKLKPLLDSLHRELSACQPRSKKLQTLIERTAELEWLFNVTGELRGGTDENRLLEKLLSAACERLQSALGVLYVPEKRLCLEHPRDSQRGAQLLQAWTQTRSSLLNWTQRQQRPLLINGTNRAGNQVTPCKILAVPVVPDSGRTLGLLAFFNPPEARDFQNRHLYLARHLGRRSAALVAAQFDLMTGLYTRDGLEQMYGRLATAAEPAERSVIYLDVDHMDVANELHGFELGNELIVRVADALCPPHLPEGSLAARITGDRFAIVLPETDPRGAARAAADIQQAVAKLIIGPADAPLEVSVSCGVAALVDMPEGFARALAAAELACKSAKRHGRNRVELYAVEDSSMLRRH